jgi:purine catabolism regulator
MGRASNAAPEVTLARLLAVPAIQVGQPEVLAGHAQLQSRVRWVHVSEELDIAQYLRGGEVLLSSGMALTGASETDMSAYVLSLVQHGVAALILRTSSGSAPPEALLHAAAELDFPLIWLRRQVDFVDITEHTHDLLLGHRIRWMQQVELFRTELLELALTANATELIVERLVEITHTTVALESHSGELLAIRGTRGKPTGALRDWSTNHPTRHAVYVNEIRAGNGCVWVGIPVRGRLLATLHVLGVHAPIDESIFAAVEAAMPALRLALSAAPDSPTSSTRGGQHLIDDLLTGRLTSEADIRTALDGQRVSVAEAALMTFSCRVFRAPPSGDGDPSFRPQPAQLTPLGALLEPLRGHLRAMEAGCSWSLLVVQGDTLFGFAREDSGMRDTIRDQLTAAHARLQERAGNNLVVCAGIGDATQLMDLPVALGEALDALRLGRGLDAVRVTSFVDIALERMLEEVPAAELDGFVDDELGTLCAYDAERGTALIDTLSTYFDSSRNATEAARNLFIERRTLYHRLDSIRGLLRSPALLDEPGSSLELAIAALHVADTKAGTQSVSPLKGSVTY